MPTYPQIKTNSTVVTIHLILNIFFCNFLFTDKRMDQRLRGGLVGKFEVVGEETDEDTDEGIEEGTAVNCKTIGTAVEDDEWLLDEVEDTELTEEPLSDELEVEGAESEEDILLTDYEISKLGKTHPNSNAALKHLKEDCAFMENIGLILLTLAEGENIPVPPLEHTVLDLLNGKTGGHVTVSSNSMVDHFNRVASSSGRSNKQAKSSKKSKSESKRRRSKNGAKTKKSAKKSRSSSSSKRRRNK